MKRRPPPKNARNVRYIDGNYRSYAGNKVGDMVQAESFAERKLLLLLERDPDVINYISQPQEAVIEYVNSKGQKRRYVPDYLAKCLNGPDCVYEVTLRSRLENNLALQERSAAGHAVCKARNQRYLVFTEEVLPDDTETANLLLFYSHRRDRCANDHVAEAALKRLASERRMHMSQLLNTVIQDTGLDRGQVNIALKYMIWHGQLEINWHNLFYETSAFTGKSLSPSAFVWVGKD